MQLDLVDAQRILQLPESVRLTLLAKEMPPVRSLHHKDPKEDVRALIQKLALGLESHTAIVDRLEQLGEKLESAEKASQAQELLSATALVISVLPQIAAFATGVTPSVFSGSSLMITVAQTALLLWNWKKDRV